MEPKIQADPGQSRYWSVKPFDNQEATVRVNQLLDHSHNPPHFKRPCMEVSIFWLDDLEELAIFALALALARKQWVKWNRQTGTEA